MTSEEEGALPTLLWVGYDNVGDGGRCADSV